VIKFESDFVGEEVPDPGRDGGGVAKLAVAIALGKSFEADRLRKEVLMALRE
jgi:hypothetical protein